MPDPTQRFSSRVENYIKYRPGYPGEVITLLEQECGLTSAATVADIGSGTGILTEPFLKHGNPVFAVEPNPEMRAAAERLLAGHPNFRSVNGTAEATRLADLCADLITAGQAFHWFDPDRTRREFVRVLKPGGWVALIWNERRTLSTPFLKDYENLLLAYATDYAAVNHANVDAAAIQAFFAPGTATLRSFPNRQVFDFQGLLGRLMSASYAPEPGHPRHEPMLAELASIFQAHEQNGAVTFDYDTLVYYGRLPDRA